LRVIDELRVSAPSYILLDGTRIAAADYFALVGAPEELETLRERFDRRLIGAVEAGNVVGTRGLEPLTPTVSM
jgi:hypothetical protein